MSEVRMSLPMARRFGETSRRDLWWVQPAVVFAVLLGFVVYATIVGIWGTDHYYTSPERNGSNYLSPFFSPEVLGNSPHAWFPKPTWWPEWLLFSPAVFILWGPGGFRVTCYYYRGAYYKAFWADPPSCAVGEPRQDYWGERRLPLILQNVHRYFLYVALVFLIFLSWDVIHGCAFSDGRDSYYGIGVGTLVLLVNVILLGGYTFSCHSFRHLVGGYVDQLTRAPLRHRMYNCASCLNRWHPVWAWCSLIWVGFSDVYVRLVSMGVWHDYVWRIT